MQLSLEVQFLDGSDPVTVETTLFTTVLWERKYKRKASELGSAIGQEDLAYLAYEASKMLANTNFKNIFYDEQIPPQNDAWAQQPQNHRGFRVAWA